MRAMHLGIRDVERFEMFVRLRRQIADHVETRFSEEQILRVDVPGSNERLRLLRAPIGVRRIDEAALTVHELVKISARSGKLLTEVVSADLEEFSTDGV